MTQINYPYLPEGKNFLYVSLENPFMKEAYEVGKTSNETMQPTSAVVVKDGVIIGKAASKAPISNKWLMEKHREGWCIRKMLKIKTGTKYWMCPGCAGFECHSEPRGVADAQKNGFDTNGADLYHWGHWWCCESCWNAMLKGGIKQVYLLEGSEKLFNPSSATNILGKQFKEDKK